MIGGNLKWTYLKKIPIYDDPDPFHMDNELWAWYGNGIGNH